MDAGSLSLWETNMSEGLDQLQTRRTRNARGDLAAYLESPLRVIGTVISLRSNSSPFRGVPN